MRFPRSFIDEVRTSADPVQVIGEVVALKRRGTRFVGLCPFHQEKTPSFTVNDEGLWYCFGCGTGGDIFRFIMEQEGVGFGEAVRSVAERLGIPAPEPERGPGGEGPRGPKVDRARVLEAMSMADSYYRDLLAGDAGAAAREFLAGRGFTEETVATFSLGLALDSWEALRSHLQKRGFTDVEGVTAGLLRRREEGRGVYDLLRARVVFPIHDLRGRTIAFGGRVLDGGEPKYLNSPETPVFSKSRSLYGLAENRDGIKEHGFALLVEGYFDLLACAQYGFRNAVAPLGTAFTADQAKILARFSRKVVVSFDGDSAGLSAAERTVGVFLSQGFQVNVLRLPADHDPDSFLADEGAEAYRQCLRGSESALEFLVHRAGERQDLGTPRGKAEALSALLEFVVAVEDRVERAEWIGRLAERLQLQRHLVEMAAAEALGKRPRGRGQSEQRVGDGARESSERSWQSGLEEPPLAEKELLRAIVAHPDWRVRLDEICESSMIRDSRVRALLLAMEECETEGVVPGIPELLARCEFPGIDALLSRLQLEDGAPQDWSAARNCALGIHDDAIKRQLRGIQQSIEEALRQGDSQRYEALNREKIDLARQLTTA
jgi:DNA primase